MFLSRHTLKCNQGKNSLWFCNDSTDTCVHSRSLFFSNWCLRTSCFLVGKTRTFLGPFILLLFSLSLTHSLSRSFLVALIALNDQLDKWFTYLLAQQLSALSPRLLYCKWAFAQPQKWCLNFKELQGLCKFMLLFLQLLHLHSHLSGPHVSN